MNARLMLLVVGLSASAFAQRPPELERAQTAMGERHYEVALKALDGLWKKPNLERDTVLTVLELRGLALASTGKADAADESFRALLALDPHRPLAGKYQGKAAGPIAAAVKWFEGNGALEVSALPPGAQNGRVKQLGLQVKNDGLQLGRVARFHVRGESGVWKVTDAPLLNGAATLDVDGATFDWWAELLGERTAQLVFLASAGRPVHDVAPAPVAVVTPEPVKASPPSDRPVESPAPSLTPTQVSQPGPLAGPSTVRTVGYVLLGAGVVAAAIGVYFGVTSSSLRSGIMADLTAGRSTQADLYARDQRAIMNATIANALFIGAGVVGITGGVLWFVGRTEVQLAAGPGSVSVTGRF
jgi:hypothetical protein